MNRMLSKLEEMDESAEQGGEGSRQDKKGVEKGGGAGPPEVLWYESSDSEPDMPSDALNDAYQELSETCATVGDVVRWAKIDLKACKARLANWLWRLGCCLV